MILLPLLSCSPYFHGLPVSIYPSLFFVLLLFTLLFEIPLFFLFLSFHPVYIQLYHPPFCLTLSFYLTYFNFFKHPLHLHGGACSLPPFLFIYLFLHWICHLPLICWLYFLFYGAVRVCYYMFFIDSLNHLQVDSYYSVLFCFCFCF